MMKKLFLLVLASVMWSVAMAVPAKPGIYTFQQSDGTTIHVSLIGDEWNSSFVTSDGLTVVRNDNGDFYYRNAEGITTMRAHDPTVRSADESAFVLTNKDQCKLSKIAEAKVNEPGEPGKLRSVRLKANQAINPIGTRYVPVVLVEYSDIKFKDSDPIATFQSFFNSGSTSVYQYFQDQSDGQFDPQFEILGKVTLANNRAYYGGHSSTWGNDARVGTMVAQGCLGIASSVDWTKFDNNNDGYIDAVIVIYAGVGEASSGVENAVWPCRWQIYGSDYGYSYVTVDGKKINDFGVFNELSGYNTSKIDGIGTVCHEFSHVLGLPDYYDTNYANHFGMGDWSLMDGGCYNNDGYTPCGYGSYEKMFMGWRQLEDAVPGTTYTIEHTANSTARGIKVPTSNQNEYYILDNIQKKGWNAYAHNSGLLVTHVYYSSSAWSNNTVNNTNTRRMTIIPADNSLKMNLSSGYYFADSSDQTGDLYPYNGNNELTDESTPAAATYTGTGLMGKPITNIKKNSDGTVSFVYIASAAFGGDAPTIAVDEATIGPDGFTVNWAAMPNALSYKLRLLPFTASLTESFKKCTTTVETALNGSIDQYMDNSGWQAYRARQVEGGLRLGNSGANGTLGYIYNNTLDFTETSGKAVVEVTAYSYDDDNATMKVTCGGKDQTVELTRTPTTFTLSFDEINEATSQQLRFGNAQNGKRVVVTHAVLSLPSGGSEQIVDGITGTSYTFTGLAPKTTYLIDGLATYSGGDSDWSDKVSATTKTIDNYILGDANLDQTVNVFDVVTTALYALQQAVSPFWLPAADVNADGIIDVTDIVGIVNISLGVEPDALQASMLEAKNLNGSDLVQLSVDPFSLKAGETREIALNLSNSKAKTALQFDILLPMGVTLDNVSLTGRNDAHVVSEATVEGGKHRILLYSNDNSAIRGNNGAVLNITLSAADSFTGTGELGFDNIVIADRDMNRIAASPFNVIIGNAITAIDNVSAGTRFYHNGDNIIVESPVDQTVTVTAVNGMSRTIRVNAGKTAITLPDHRGIYIIKVGDKVTKISR